MKYLGIGLVLLMAVEVLSIVLVSSYLGAWTLLLMLLFFMVGFIMLKNFGTSRLLIAASMMRSGGQISLYQMFWPIRYGLAAILFMLPGFLSDLIALLFLIPFKGKPLDLNGRRDNNIFSSNSTAKREKKLDINEIDVVEGEFKDITKK